MSLKINTIANYLGQGWVALMGLAFVPLYIRYLGLEAWGLVGFMALLQAWFALLDMGLSPTLSREMARFQAGAHSAQSIRDLLRSLEVIYGVTAVVIIGIVWFTAPWLASHWLGANSLDPATVVQAIAMMGLVLASRMVEQVYRGSIQGLHKQVWLNVAQSLLATFRSAGAVCLLAWYGVGIEGFFWWQALISVVGLVILASRTYRWLPRAERNSKFRLDSLYRIKSFAGGMAVTTLLVLCLTQVDKVLLSTLVSLEDFGRYSLAASAAGALYMLVSPIVSAVSPRLTELVSKTEDLTLIATYHRSSQWLGVVLIPAALVMMVFAEPLLFVWTGDSSLAEQTGPLLRLLALGTMCNGLMHVPYAAQLAHGWTGFAVRMNVIAVCLIVPSILWAVPRFGAEGAAWAWAALNMGYVIVGVHFMHFRLFPGEKWNWYLNSVAKPLGAGLLVSLTLHQGVILPNTRIATAVTILAIGLLVILSVMMVVPSSRDLIHHKLKKLAKPA